MAIVKVVRDSSIPVEAGENIEADEVCSISSSDGLAYLACAGTGIEELPVVGVAETDAATGEMVELKRFAQIEDMTGLNEGGPVYLSNTPGAVQATAGDTAHIVGIAITDTKYFLDPEIIGQQTQH